MHDGTTLIDAVRMWPTPTGIHADRGNHDEPIENYKQRVRDYEEGRTKGKPGKSLGVATRMWPTPRTPTGGPESAERKQELGRTESGGGDLTSAVRVWPTATSRDWKDSPGMSFDRKDRPPGGRIDLLPRAVFADGLRHRDESNSHGKPLGLLNPDWVEQLMGFQRTWTRITLRESIDSAHLGTPSSPQ